MNAGMGASKAPSGGHAIARGSLHVVQILLDDRKAVAVLEAWRPLGGHLEWNAALKPAA
jgi:hypothetical protein